MFAEIVKVSVSFSRRARCKANQPICYARLSGAGHDNLEARRVLGKFTLHGTEPIAASLTKHRVHNPWRRGAGFRWVWSVNVDGKRIDGTGDLTCAPKLSFLVYEHAGQDVGFGLCHSRTGKQGRNECGPDRKSRRNPSQSVCLLRSCRHWQRRRTTKHTTKFPPPHVRPQLG